LEEKIKEDKGSKKKDHGKLRKKKNTLTSALENLMEKKERYASKSLKEHVKWT
jgi:hypothetical protein